MSAKCVCASPCWPRSVSVSPDPYNSPLKNFRLLTRKQKKLKFACAQYISSWTVITVLNSMPITIIYPKFLLLKLSDTLGLYSDISMKLYLICMNIQVVSIKWIKNTSCSIQFISLSMAVSLMDQLYRENYLSTGRIWLDRQSNHYWKVVYRKQAYNNMRRL